MKPEAGIYPGMSRETYEAIDGINQSILKVVNKKSPMHALAEMHHPREPTVALIVGDALHQAILEPSRFEQEYCSPAMDEQGRRFDRRTKIGKAAWAAWEAQNEGKTAINNADDWNMIHQVRREVWAKPTTRAVLSGPGQNEVALVWQDPVTGLWCKALIDRIQQRKVMWLWDLKSTVDASPTGFPRQCALYDYHFQAGWYLWGAEVLFGKADRRFGFLAVEKERPWATKAFEAKPSVIEQGQLEARAALNRWAECVERDEYPGYGDEITPFHLPEWRYKEIEA